MPERKPGIISVTMLHGKHTIRRDFDAQEWRHEWTQIGDATVLRMLHDNDPDATESFDFVEFSAPVVIEYTYDAGAKTPTTL